MENKSGLSREQYSPFLFKIQGLFFFFYTYGCIYWDVNTGVFYFNETLDVKLRSELDISL